MLVVEKNRKPGVKILMSGGTRCNLTHATDVRGIIEAYGDQGKFLHSALALLDPAGVIELFRAEGVEVKTEETGKVFPVSDSAVDVQQALLRRLDRAGAELRTGVAVVEITPRAKGGFQLTTTAGELTCKRLIVTTGGKSFPGCGTTGDGYAWAQKLGHSIVEPRPALTPVLTDEAWVKSLQGVTIPDAAIAVRVCPEESDAPKPPQRALRGRLPKDGVLARRRSSLLFTHIGVSGPAALDVSRAVTAYPKPRALELVCDFLPGCSAEELERQWMLAASREGGKLVVNLASQQLPRRVVETLLAQTGVSLELRGAEWSKILRKALVERVKASRFPISGTLGFEKAEVTAGGVELREVDSRTMESRLMPDLYFAGEILDLDGPIGGYNFQAAFSTGMLAGVSAAQAE